MFRLKLTLCILLLVCSSCMTAGTGLNPSIPLKHFKHSYWTIDNGLPQNSVNAVVQSDDGYLWLATQEGLVRFDGIHFHVYDTQNTPELKSNYFWKLFKDKEGTIWAGTISGEVYYLKNGVIKRYKPDVFYKEIVTSFLQDSKGIFWISTEFTLYQITNNTVHTFTSKDGFTGYGAISLCEDKSGIVWIGSASGLYFYKDGKIRKYSNNGFKETLISSLYNDSNNLTWFAATSGLYQIRRGNVFKYPRQNRIAGKIILSITGDAKGNIFIGTDKGLNRIINDRIENFTLKDGLSDHFAKSLLIDNDGSLWIGTYAGGINQIKDSKFLSYTKTEGLSDNFVLSILEDSKENLWIGTYGGGLNKFHNGKFEWITSIDEINNGVVTGLGEDKDGNIWIGVLGKGIIRYNSNSTKIYTPTSGLVSTNINSLFVDSENKVWVGTADGLNVINGDEIKFYNKKEGLSNNHVLYITEDKTKNIWLATANGLFKFRDGKFTRYSTRDGLSSNFILCIYEDKKGILWIGTNGGGLNRFNPNKNNFVVYDTKNGLYNNVVFHILEDESGCLWMSCNKGIFRVCKNELEGFAAGKKDRIFASFFTKNDGMKISECTGRHQPSGWKSKNGTLWFATIEGITAITPSKMQHHKTPPKVIIENFFVDGNKIEFLKDVKLSPGKKTYEFQYTGIDFTSPEKIKFKYKLEGFDKKWIDADGRRNAYYTNIPPGDYTFRVICGNNDNYWNYQSAVFSFQLEPRFYETTLFYVICIGLLITLGPGILFYRVHQLKKREKLLQALVAERTKKISEEMRKTEQALQEAKMQKVIAEAANALKSEFLGIAAHDLRSPLQSIMGFSQMIGEDASSSDSTRSQAKNINNSSERMLKLINELLNFARLDDSEFKLKIEEINLQELIREIIAHNEISLRLKKQRISLNNDQCCKVQGDTNLIYQVIENLVNNAIKFSPLNSTIYINLEKLNSSILIKIRDEGPGLTSDDISKIFVRFQRLSAKPTGGETSTGLGLSIVKKIVDLHKGKIWVESNLGNGSTFFVDLPE